MTNLESGRFLSALRAKEADVAAGLRRRDGLAIEAEADVFDQIQGALDRALVVRNLDCSSALLREIRDAMERIANGEYGLCLACGQEINLKRLAVLPWAALCLPCQEEADAKSTGVESWAPLAIDGVERYR